MRFVGRLSGALLVAGAIGIGSAHAQAAADYPTRPVDIVVAFSPGGSTSLSGQAMAAALEKRLGQPFKVVHKPGGNTIPALDEVMRAPPDGYTLFLDSQASGALLEVAVPNLRADIANRTFIAVVAAAPQTIFVASGSPLKSLDDVVAKLKADPGSFSWTSLGGVSGQDFTFRKLFKSAGVPVKATRPVASKGGSEPITMVASGHVLVGAGTTSSVLPLIEAGKIRALAVTSPERSPSLPDVKTTAELGYPDVEVVFWTGLSGPPNMPPEIVAKIVSVLAEMTKDPEFVGKLNAIGMLPSLRTGEPLKTMLESERKQAKELWSQ